MDIKRLPKALPEQPGDAIAAVVITISGLESYDTLFSSVPQQSDEGTTVHAFALNAEAGVTRLLAALQAGHAQNVGGDNAAIYGELLEAIGAVPSPDCVVINFECCGAYGDHGFCKHQHHQPGEDASVDLIALAVDRGFMVMCSDFSLKALIAKWTAGGALARRLGQCPFVKTGEFSGTMKL